MHLCTLLLQVFRGNVDDVAAVTSIFQRPIRARYVRILPTRYKEWPSMRIELIGCKGRHTAAKTFKDN